jgi:S-formylglutathione hydrolase FrmB
LQKENIEKTFIVGMSMGGYPSQHFAAMYSDIGKRIDFSFPVLILADDKDRTGKAFCKWR